MCGIAGIIYGNGNGSRDIGRDMTLMLQSMKHRGPDSTGYALFGPHSPRFVMRYTLADANDARDFEFADRIRRDTDGYGVDIVLNSVTGAAQRAGIEILSFGGRFVEIGKRDI